MSNPKITKVPQAEDLVYCPFDSLHVMKARTFQHHLIKCAKKYPDWVTCPYNATHRFSTTIKLEAHQPMCEDRPSQAFDLETYSQVTRYDGLYVPQLDVVSSGTAVGDMDGDISGEDWDSEELHCDNGGCRADNVHSHPAYVQPYPANVHSHPANVQPYPANVHSHPANVQSYTANVQPRPANVQSYPPNVHSHPDNMQPHPANKQAHSVHVQPGSANVLQNCASEGPARGDHRDHLERHCSRGGPLGIISKPHCNTNVPLFDTSDTSESKSDTNSSESDTIEAQSDAVEPQNDSSEPRGEASCKQPGVNTQSPGAGVGVGMLYQRGRGVAFTPQGLLHCHSPRKMYPGGIGRGRILNDSS